MKEVSILILFIFCINVSSFAQDVVSCETDELTGDTICESDIIQISAHESDV